MSYTVEQFRKSTTEFERNTFEAGKYTMRVNKVKQQVAKFGFNAGKEVLTFIINPLEDENNADSYDNSRTIFVDAALPVFTEGMSETETEDAQKALSALAYWAETLGIVDIRPPRADKSAPAEVKAEGWRAYQEWTVNAANTLVDSPSSAEGKCFRGEVKLKESKGKFYPQLSGKARL